MLSRKRAFRAATAVGALALAGTAHSALAAQFFEADLTSLNGSGVKGVAQLELSDDMTTLKVAIAARGLEPNMNHPGHIHGRFNDAGEPIDSFTPTLAQDMDGDGFIELAEGADTYGPIIVSLPDLVDAGPEAPMGRLLYRATFNLMNPATFAAGFSRDDLLPLSLREVVLHGMTVPAGIGAGTEGEVNGTNGYLAVLPVASGELSQVDAFINPIPEPATWAMMLLGFGAVGVGLRRRKQAKQMARVQYAF